MKRAILASAALGLALTSCADDGTALGGGAGQNSPSAVVGETPNESPSDSPTQPPPTGVETTETVEPPIVGEACCPPVINIPPPAVFEAFVRETTPGRIDVTNDTEPSADDAGAIEITSLLFDATTQPTPFHINLDACEGSVIATGETCPIDVVFAPLTPGDFTGTIHIEVTQVATGEVRTQEIRLRGNARPATHPTEPPSQQPQ